MHLPFILLLCLLLSSAVYGQQKTYCNPINLDYGYTPIPNFSEWGRHRATADPVLVNFKNHFYLFSTNQWGYWHTADFISWKFVPRKFLLPRNMPVYDELCAPAVGIVGDTLLVFGSTITNAFPIWMSTNPQVDDWKPAVDSLKIGGWDPDFFTDTDGRLYMYNGSSNRYPLYGIELNRKTFQPIGSRKELLLLDTWRYGWQRFGEYMDDTFLDGFIEGAHMTKHGGKYYLQYGSPGSEMSGYADGVAVGNSPLGPFTHQSDPLSMKLGGFARGAGHGSTFQDNNGLYWHISSIIMNRKNSFERRLGYWPTGFDSDGVMYCRTAYGDYPHYLPHQAQAGAFTGWMLLNYQSPVQVSSTLGGYYPNFAVDEDMKTYWCAQTAQKGEWLQTDLGKVQEVRAIQLNFADQGAHSLGKVLQQAHQYIIWHSTDGKKWEKLIDKSENQQDVPHDYVELAKPIATRFLKIENIQMPQGLFALSGFRVFGYGRGQKPSAVNQLMVLRTEKDKRSAWLRWQPVDQAQGYVIHYGTHPDKLYNAIMVYQDNQYWFRGMDSQKTYYYTIEAFNENGISGRYPTVEVN